MTPSGIFLSHSALSSFSSSTRDELQRYLFNYRAEEIDGPAEVDAISTISEDEPDGPADLSVAQARKLVAGCSDRPKAALRFIAEHVTTSFPYQDMVKAIGLDSSGTIRGVLAAITRRTRTVLGDPQADLIWFEGEPDTSIGTVSDMTRSSLRKVFAIS